MTSYYGKPLVSVLICTHNAEAFIGPTVGSVFLQTYKNVEILIHDDASSDGTLDVIAKLKNVSPFPMKIYSSAEPIGPYRGLNLLLEKSNGNYVAILDHDDFWSKDKVALQASFLDCNKNYEACGSNVYIWFEKFNKLKKTKLKNISKDTYHSTLMFRNKNSYRYRENISYRNDFYFMHTCLCAGNKSIYNIQEALAIWKIWSNGNNLSQKWLRASSIISYTLGTYDLSGGVSGMLSLVIPKHFFYYLFSLIRTKKDVNLMKNLSSKFPTFHPCLRQLNVNTGTKKRCIKSRD